MHWFTRAVIAIVAGCGFAAWYAAGLWNEVELAIHFVLTGSKAFKPFSQLLRVISIISTLPVVCVAFAVYGALSRWLGPAAMEVESRCRKCGYILRGLPEPRCPECGEVI